MANRRTLPAPPDRAAHAQAQGRRRALLGSVAQRRPGRNERPRLAAAGGTPAAPAHAPVAFAPASALSLPTLSRGIPKVLKVQQGISSVIAMADALATMGALVEWHDDPVADVQRAVDAWLQRQIHDISYLDNVSFAFTNQLSTLSECHFDGSDEKDKRTGCLALQVETYAENLYSIKAHAERLEQECPGLAAPVFQTLENALDVCVGCAGPLGALGIAVDLHWQGEDDETEAQRIRLDDELDYYLRNGDVTLEHFAMHVAEWQVIHDSSDWFTRAEFHSEIPEWLVAPYYFRRNANHRRRIKELAPLVPQHKALLDLVLAVDTALPPDFRDDYQFNRFDMLEPLILFWEPFGMVGKLYDDKGQHTMEGDGVNPIASMRRFNPLDPKQIRNAFRDYEKMFDGMRLADQLLRQLARPVSRKEQQLGPLA